MYFSVFWVVGFEWELRGHYKLCQGKRGYQIWRIWHNWGASIRTQFCERAIEVTRNKWLLLVLWSLLTWLILLWASRVFVRIGWVGFKFVNALWALFLSSGRGVYSFKLSFWDWSCAWTTRCFSSYHLSCSDWDLFFIKFSLRGPKYFLEYFRLIFNMFNLLTFYEAAPLRFFLGTRVLKLGL